MNKILDYNVTGQHIELSSAAMLVAGTVNEYTARFSFNADWDGYQRVAVFNADGTDREQLLTDDVCKVPWEVLLPGAYLKVGVYGTRDGSRLPTIWTTHRQYIHDGAGPTDEAADPSPVLAEQILQRMGDLGQLKTEDKSSLVAAINEVKETGGGGTADHTKLQNRDAADQHPMSAITGLEQALDGKQPTGDYLTEEQDPTVPEWAKQPQKPAYTAQEVGALPATTHIPSTAEDVNAEPAGAVSQHNVSDEAHSDIRLIIQGLSERLSAVADSDDATLDQLSEIVAYIKSNKSLIDAITTSKVNVADIVDNLTTNVANKPLSAAQGVALKAIIDALTIPTALSELTEDTTHRVVTDAEKAVWNAKSNFTGSYNDLTDKPTIPAPYTLPIASSTVLGGVQPVAKTDAMTQSVGVDAAGALWAAEASGGGSGTSDWTYQKITLSEAVSAIEIPFDNAKEVVLVTNMRINNADNTLSNANGNYSIRVNYRYAAMIGCYIRDSTKYAAWHKIEKIKSHTQLFSTTAYDNGANWSASKSVSQCGWWQTQSDDSEYINFVSLAPYNNSEWVFPADCVVEVWSK